MRHRRTLSVLSASCLAIFVASGSFFGGKALDHWLTKYRDIDLSAPRGVQESLPPDSLRVKRTEKRVAKQFMVTASHPASAQAGGDILSKGGSALDAVIAAQAVAGLVQPHATGFGGGGVLLYWKHDTRQLRVYDGRGVAPQAIDRRIFLNADGSSRNSEEITHGGGSILVPGLARLFEAARKKHGGLPLSQLFSAAMDLSRTGFPLDPILIEFLEQNGFLKQDGNLPLEPVSGSLSVGAKVVNEAYFTFLNRLAAVGFGGFYKDDLAQDMVRAVLNAPGAPGSLSLDDLHYYAALERSPKCLDYRGSRICAPPAPSEGGLSILQTLGILESVELKDFSNQDVQAIQLITEASKLAQADSNRYVADSAFTHVPAQGLLNKAYLQLRALEINTSSSGKIAAKAGLPPNAGSQLFASQLPKHDRVATHIIATDPKGDIAILVSSLEQPFGSKVSVHGFFLNNGLLGFSKKMAKNGAPVRNRIEPSKRPGYDWAPIMVIGEEGLPRYALGLSGGADLTTIASKTLVSILDWGQTPQTAFAQPHFSYSGGMLRVEVNTGMSDMAVRLRNRGYQVRLGSFPSDFQGIAFVKGTGAIAAIDPRAQSFSVTEKNLMAATADAFQFIIPAPEKD